MPQESVVVVKDGLIFEIPFNSGFEKRHDNGSWVKLCTLIAQNCNTFTKIGLEFEISCERVRQLNRDYIAPYLDNKTGHERRRVCALARVHIKEFPPAVLGVWRTARKNGLHVAAMNSLRNRGKIIRTIKNALWLNDTLCYIYAADATTVNNARLRTVHFSFRGQAEKDKFAFSLFVIVNPSQHWSSWIYYVIPRENIPDGVLSICLPFGERRSYSRRKYDWLQFRDAWGLIPPYVKELESDQ